MPSPVRFASALALTLACSFFVPLRAGEISNTDAELQFQLANLLFDETRYWEALQAFERASEAPDRALALRALKGKVRTQLRVAEFVPAMAEAQKLRTTAPTDPEALSLYADSLWAYGLFDEADAGYRLSFRLIERAVNVPVVAVERIAGGHAARAVGDVGKRRANVQPLLPRHLCQQVLPGEIVEQLVGAGGAGIGLN